MKKKYIISFLSVGCIFLILLLLFSRLVEPKYTGRAKEGALISEYYRETDRGRVHDVIFIGDCEVYSSFVPPVLYEKYGITSFVRGSPSQSMSQSYYLLCETLKYEKPEVVVLGAYAMCKSESPDEAYNRMTLDGMRLSVEKVRAVYESMGEEESMLSYLLPLLRFHSRIFELEEDDLRYLFVTSAVSHNGYFMQTGIKSPSGEYLPEGEAGEALPSENFGYLDKIAKACRDNGVKLVLVKPPTSSWRYPWYDSWDRELAEYSERENISYYKLDADDCGVDMSEDSYDGGLHLNVWGAEKVSVYFGALLAENYGVGGERSDIWNEKVKLYYNERNGK